MAAWITRLIVSSALVTLISVTTTWFVVHSYVVQLLKGFHMEEYAKSVSLSSVMAGMGEALFARKEPASKLATARIEPIPAGRVDSSSGGTGGGSGGAAGSSERKGTVTYPPEPPEDALAVMGRISSSDRSKEKELLVSADDLNRKKDSLTGEEKMKIFSILFSKLPPNEWQKLSATVEDGVTKEELDQIERIVRSYVTPEEYAELMRILEKLQ